MDGAILSHQLLERGYYVIGAKRRTSSFNTERIDDIWNHKNFHIEYFDLNDASSINRLISAYKPNEIYNMACQSHVQVSFSVPEDTINGIVMGTLHILEAIKNYSKWSKFYSAASSEQFGNYDPSPKDEVSKFSPCSPYAVGKVAAHNLVKMYREAYNLFVVSGICFNHEMPGSRGETFVTRKITKGVAKIVAGKQEKLELGNINAVRDWGYAQEFMEGAWLMLQQPKPEDYVLATGESHSVRSFILETLYLAGLSKELSEEEAIAKHVVINPIYYRPTDVLFLQGNPTKARLNLGWTPKTKFKQLVKLMFEADLAKELNG